MRDIRCGKILLPKSRPKFVTRGLQICLQSIGRTRVSIASQPVTTENAKHAQLCKNMTSSTKPEVYNVLHCRQRREPRTRVTLAENFVKFGPVVLEICERTDRHTYRRTDRHRPTDALIAILRMYPYEGEIITVNSKYPNSSTGARSTVSTCSV